MSYVNIDDIFDYTSFQIDREPHIVVDPAACSAWQAASISLCVRSGTSGALRGTVAPPHAPHPAASSDRSEVASAPCGLGRGC